MERCSHQAEDDLCLREAQEHNDHHKRDPGGQLDTYLDQNEKKEIKTNSSSRNEMSDFKYLWDHIHVHEHPNLYF